MAGRAKKPAAPRKKANGYKMPAPIASGEVIQDLMKKKWRIGPSIGVGGFGEIYSACDHESSPKKGSSYPYVIKIEPHENGPLFVEMHFYIRNCNKDDIINFMKSRKLSTLGMPQYYSSGSHDYKGEKYRYIVMERYGRDLWNIFIENGRRFPPATVFQIGLQMLDVLEYIHSRGYVHADLKGANMMLGLKKGSENQVFLLDFGLATKVSDKDFKPDPKKAHDGTIEYTSRDAHLGVATMRGDLEILAYNMLQWIAGQLPWEGSLKNPKAVQDAKEEFMKNVKANVAKIGGNVPDALVKFFEHINSLKPKNVPDYAKCRSIFEAYLKTQGKTRNSKLEFAVKGSKGAKGSNSDDTDGTASTGVAKLKKRAPKQNGDAPKVKKTKKAAIIAPDSDPEDENQAPEITKQTTKAVKKRNKTNYDSDPEDENQTPKITKKTNKVVKKRNKTNSDSDPEDENPTPVITKKITKTVIKRNKRKSSEPLLLVKVKKAKLAPKNTPPIKENHVNIATQTSNKRKSPRQVSFDSPVSEIIEETGKKNRSKTNSINSSGDIFDDSFVIEDKKVKPKKRLLSDEEVTVKKVIKKKTTTVLKKSWKDLPSVVNGRCPPK